MVSDGQFGAAPGFIAGGLPSQSHLALLHWIRCVARAASARTCRRLLDHLAAGCAY